MKKRNDIKDSESPDGIDVLQITSDNSEESAHIYMEAQVFTPDSKRFLLHASARSHGQNIHDPMHRYLLCDIENGFTLSPLIHEPGATSPSVSPVDPNVYYFVNNTTINDGTLALKRVKLDGSGRETIMVLNGPVPGTRFRASRLYPLSTIRSDGKKLAISCFLGDGQSRQPPWGLLVFDIETSSVELILHGPTWCNVHPQYSRSKDVLGMHDILIQENHGNICTPGGSCRRLTGGNGADVHVIRDDGRGFRDMPWGRSDNEHCQGHQCWRGRSMWAVTSTETRDIGEEHLIESRAVPHAGHIGLRSPGGIRNDLSRNFESSHFSHFATDIEGKLLISDNGDSTENEGLFLASLGQPGTDKPGRWQYLLNPRSSMRKEAHIHPFLSPDGSIAFFNSDETGGVQAYAITGLPNIPIHLLPAPSTGA